MPNSDQRPKVTIEDLLRLKKAERPAADFWSNFERELREKQLSALVEKPSWWHSVPQLLARRVYLPIGATAILAFSLISIKYYNPVPLAQTQGASGGAVPAIDYSEEYAAAVSSENPVSSPLVNRSEPTTPKIDERAAGLAAIAVPAENVSPASVGIAAPVKESLSARSIADNLAHLQQSEPELINAVLGSRLSAPARVQAASAPVVELASLSINGSKRTRLLAHYNDRQVSAEPATADGVRERVSHRLADSDFNDRFSRFGLNANRVSLKF